ncbi:redox-regulated ATPase YchF [bacterium]|nr:redox-regulated ATPase YchF [bacterium]
MRIALIGLPQSGKTSLFDALTGRRDEPGGYSAPGSAHLGMAPVLDPRVEAIAKLLKPKKVTYAPLEFVDLAGLFAGEKPPPEAVAAMRDADGLMKFVRAFESDTVPHTRTTIDPKRDLAEIDGDLFITDLDIIERSIASLEASVHKPTVRQQEEKERLAVLRRCHEQLEGPGGKLDLSPDDEKIVRSYCFLTTKPALTLLNIGDGQIGDADADAALGDVEGTVLPVCAAMERELLDLDPEDRAEFLEDLGLEGLSGQKIIDACLDTIGLITFFTAGDKELRAWLIPRGYTALEAAAKIHSDIARGFIRAEVVLCDDFFACGSWRELRAQGKIRLEGKEYVVQDGDIINVRFNI